MKETALKDYLAEFGDIPLPEGEIKWLQNTLVCIPTHLKVEKTQEEPQITGLILGRIQKEKFRPAFPLLDHIGKHTKQSITLDDKSAYLFTCGRDIFGKTVEHKPKDDPRVVIVKNERDEVLGVASNDRKKGMFMNSIDRGLFLRQEMNKKK